MVDGLIDRLIYKATVWAGQVEFFSDFSSEKSIETAWWGFPAPGLDTSRTACHST
jgi:hypothetical protein